MKQEEIRISKSDLVGDYSNNLPEMLECLLCSDLVIDPWECSACNQLYCEEHIKRLLNQKCPNEKCRADKWKKGIDVHIAYRRTIESLRLVCRHDQCRHHGQFSYEEYVRHLKETDHKVSAPTFTKQKKEVKDQTIEPTRDRRITIRNETPPRREETPPSRPFFTAHGQVIRRNTDTRPETTLRRQSSSGSVHSQTGRQRIVTENPQRLISPLPPATQPSPYVITELSESIVVQTVLQPPPALFTPTATLHNASVTTYSTGTASRTVYRQFLQQSSQFFQYYKSPNGYSVPFPFGINLLINFSCDRNVWNFKISLSESVNLQAKLYYNSDTN